MSVFQRTINRRLLWLCPAAVMASWLAVRTLGASAELPSSLRLQADKSPATSEAVETVEIRDAALAQMIGRFAAAARAVAQSDR